MAVSGAYDVVVVGAGVGTREGWPAMALRCV